MCDYTNHMFPYLIQESLDEFSSLQYWRPALPDVEDEIDALFATENYENMK